jgi:hypothetical protein
MGDFRTFSEISEIVPGVGGNDFRVGLVSFFRPEKIVLLCYLL